MQDKCSGTYETSASFLVTSCYLNTLCSSSPFVVIPVPRHWDPDWH
ncbi:MAG: hypothetical protein ACEY3L_07605 [Wolbachia sp.]